MVPLPIPTSISPPHPKPLARPLPAWGLQRGLGPGPYIPDPSMPCDGSQSWPESVGTEGLVTVLILRPPPDLRFRWGWCAGGFCVSPPQCLVDKSRLLSHLLAQRLAPGSWIRSRGSGMPAHWGQEADPGRMLCVRSAALHTLAFPVA